MCYRHHDGRRSTHLKFCTSTEQILHLTLPTFPDQHLHGSEWKYDDLCNNYNQAWSFHTRILFINWPFQTYCFHKCHNSFQINYQFGTQRESKNCILKFPDELQKEVDCVEVFAWRLIELLKPLWQKCSQRLRFSENRS